MKIKDLVISYNDKVGFYCENLNSFYFNHLMIRLVEKYNLKTQKFNFISEIDMYFKIREVNADKYNIELREEDGSEWVFG